MRRVLRLFSVLPLAAVLAACAHGSGQMTSAPDYAPVAGGPAPSQARLIVDCVAAAASAGTYDRVQDEDTRMIRFTCAGKVARAFYDGLAAHSAATGSEFTYEGRTYRPTDKVQRNLFAVDHCVMDAAGAAQCTVNLNVGGFLAD